MAYLTQRHALSTQLYHHSYALSARWKLAGLEDDHLWVPQYG